MTIGEWIPPIFDKFSEWLLRTSTLSQDKRERHFTRLKREVLKPWLEMLRENETHTKNAILTKHHVNVKYDFERMNQQLIKDALIIHFPKLNKLKLKLEKILQKRDLEIYKLEKKYTEKFLKTEFYGRSIFRYIVYGENKFENFRISYDLVCYGNSVVAINACGDTPMRILSDLKHFYNSSQANRIRNIQKQLDKSTTMLKEEIERLLAMETLHNNCIFMK